MSETQPYIPDPGDAETISNVIKDISDQMTKVEATRDYIKEAKKGLKDGYGLPLDVIGSMIKLYHEQQSEEYFEKQKDLSNLYDVLFEENTHA